MTDHEDGELVPLGDGPVATVLAGVHPTTGEAFALKVFPGELDRRTRAALDTELRRLSALRTQAPILVADRVEVLTDGRWALRMELCSQSLPDLIDSFGPLSIPDTLALGTALAGALATAHRAGLVHGGVTPGNVLFRPSGEPVLSDFGLTLRHAYPRDPLRSGRASGAGGSSGRASGAGGSSGRASGAGGSSVDYLPPETARDGSADDRSDLYGLGAILYLALSGRPPYHGPPGEEQGERLLRVLSTPVPPLHRADVPPELAGLVSALLAKDPDARPADAATMAARLRALREAAAPTDDPAEGAAAGQGPAEDQAAPSAFDDFAAAGTPAATPSNRAAPSNAAAPSSPAAPRPQGEPILVFGPKQPRRATRTALVSAAAGALAMLAVVAVVLLLQQPDELAVSPTPPSIGVTNPSATPSQVVRLELSDPVDQGSFVQLSWRSSEPLDYAVVVAAQGEEAKVLFAQRATTYRVPVDPVRAYCFLIQGTNANQAYESQAKPIRGATCAK